MLLPVLLQWVVEAQCDELYETCAYHGHNGHS